MYVPWFNPSLSLDIKLQISFGNVFNHMSKYNYLCWGWGGRRIIFLPSSEIKRQTQLPSFKNHTQKIIDDTFFRVKLISKAVKFNRKQPAWLTICFTKFNGKFFFYLIDHQMLFLKKWNKIYWLKRKVYLKFLNFV